MTPESVSSLLSFLENEGGLSIESQSIDSAAFGNIVIVLRGRLLRVRIVRDRNEWAVEISSDQKPDEWYDMALLKEQITGRAGQDVLSFDEEAAVLRANWQGIVSMLTGRGSRKTLAALEQRGEERTRRLFPGLFN